MKAIPLRAGGSSILGILVFNERAELVLGVELWVENLAIISEGIVKGLVGQP